MNPITAARDTKIYVAVRCSTDTSEFDNTTALYVRYIDTEEASQLNVTELGCSDGSDIPGVDGCPSLTIADNGLIISSVFNSSLQGRRALRSLKPEPMHNKQAVVEVNIDKTTNAAGNIVEAWISSPGAFYVIAFENTGIKSLTMLVNISGQTGYSSSICNFEYGVAYRMYLMLFPYKTTYAVTGTVVTLPALKQICLTQFTLPTGWNFEADVFMNRTYTVLVSQSNMLLKFGARRADERVLVDNAMPSGDTMTLQLSRMSVECQPGYCGLTKAPYVAPVSPTVYTLGNNWVVYVLIVMLILLILVAIVVTALVAFAIHRYRKRTKTVYITDDTATADTNNDGMSEIELPKDTIRVMDEEEEEKIFNLVRSVEK
jgi:hypothetical protein